jgi:molybdopterin/thiamine biosynthesis adenylyltransferase
MRQPTFEIADVVSALKENGFSFVACRPDGWLKLTGSLNANGDTYECELSLDPQFFELPSIRLTKLPLGLPSVAPHLGSAGNLCYLAKGSVVLDIFDPIGQTLACIVEAEKVLSSILSGKLVDDLEDEFFVYWNGPFCLLDLQAGRLGRQQAFLSKPESPVLGVVTDDPKRSAYKLDAIGWEATDKPLVVYRIKTGAKPRPDRKCWPPKNVQQLLGWQGQLDPRCRKKIEERLAASFGSKNTHALILVESPLLTYGFLAFFEHPKDGKQNGTSSRQRMYQQKIIPLSILRIDDRYIAERNLPSGRTLANLHVYLVGCGTIGGYLADMLVKGGAGTSGGRLTLVDHDILGPQNLGRHRLGFPSLFKNKAQELRAELQRSNPGAEIIALPVDVRTAAVGTPDLIIDATGEEGLGYWLAHQIARSTPLLSVWIEGAGLAVRGLLREGTEGACYRCLSDANRAGDYRVFTQPTPTLMKGQGCEGLYVPFPASVSVQAASLAAEMIQDWANGAPGDTLRTRVLDKTRTQATSDTTPLRREKCPACGS